MPTSRLLELSRTRDADCDLVCEATRELESRMRKSGTEEREGERGGEAATELGGPTSARHSAAMATRRHLRLLLLLFFCLCCSLPSHAQGKFNSLFLFLFVNQLLESRLRVKFSPAAVPWACFRFDSGGRISTIKGINTFHGDYLRR